MESSDVIIAHPNSKEELNALASFMNDHHIPFEVAVLDSYYKKDFVDKILQVDADKMNFKGRKITIEELDQLWK